MKINIKKWGFFMMPLGLLGSGDKAKVIKINFKEFDKNECRVLNKVEDGICARIENMGIRIGKTLEVLNNKGKDPLLIKVDEARIAIERGMAMKIMVRKEI